MHAVWNFFSVADELQYTRHIAQPYNQRWSGHKMVKSCKCTEAPGWAELKITVSKSKRVPVRLRHKIEKASAAKQRKSRKESKKVRRISHPRHVVTNTI